MEIVIVAGSMPFGPNTLAVKSLGGSETAVINMANALRKRGHLVAVFCNLPAPGSPDFIQPGSVDENGVRWISLDQYQPFIVNTECDLLVVSRDFNFLNVSHQATKAVFWTHDLAMQRYTVPEMGSKAWNFHEVWTVSEWHKQQFHNVTGYPLDFIRPTRNGITKIETLDMGRIDNQLLYAARPERGLENLVKPGGIMSRLPQYNLKITMYDNFPQQMMPYYNQLFTWARALPNVELLQPMTQAELRQLMRNSFAYVYPTDFEEVSCIIARECMSVELPMISTAKGALPETLQNCGILLPDIGAGTDAYMEKFVNAVNGLTLDRASYARLQERARSRADLDWDGVARAWESVAEPRRGSVYSRAWSLLEDSDVVAAKALLEQESGPNTPGADHIYGQIVELYPYLTGKETFADYYERYFQIEDEKGSRKHPNMHGNQRFEAIAAQVAKIPDGKTILDYGCAEGVIILELATRFPAKYFIGIDFAQSNIDLCHKYAAERGLNNVEFHRGSSDEWPLPLSVSPDSFICSEVLEHVAEPWALAYFLETKCGRGGKAILTVPAGAWEASGLYDKRQWYWRAHIWHINKWMLRKMFADKEGCIMSHLTNGAMPDNRAMGHLVFTYTIDHKKPHTIDPIEKAYQHRARETVGAAMIVKNGAESILKTLNSIHRQVQQLSVALAPSTDDSRGIIERWAADHPWVQVFIKDVPQIEARAYGFDDARNASVEPLTTDWCFWIDSDEYLSGDFTRYVRPNACDSYAINQHHFTVEPVGGPTQIDKPARLYRLDRGFKFYGKVHEHAEKGPNGGPGYTILLGGVDIGHTGYVNEEVRRGRFNRNFPLLAWDREVNPDRRLGHYLWLRDMLHRVRYFHEHQQLDQARRLADEAISFYRSKWESFDAFGMGGINALAYYSEALAYLGRGVMVQANFMIDGQTGQTANLQGVFESEEELAKIVKQAFGPEFKRRKSGYW